jgi:hypothetical protein
MLRHYSVLTLGDICGGSQRGETWVDRAAVGTDPE